MSSRQTRKSPGALDGGNRPTLRDVAELASVSLATASRALNAKGEVGEDTRRRVIGAAETLGFRAVGAGRLQPGRLLTVGLLTSDSVGRFSTPVMSGVEDALGSGQVAVLLADARGDPIREQHYLRVLAERRVDGIIVVGQNVEARAPITPPRGLPVVYAYAPSSDESNASFVVDNLHGAELAVSHLLALGRTRIAHITGPTANNAARERVLGVERTLAAHKVALADEVMYGHDWSQRWGRHAATILFERTPDVDAIFCGSDQIAAGVLESLHERRCGVPDRVSIVGFDNWVVFAAQTRPSLTTVDMNLEQLGRMAAEWLVTAMDGEAEGGLRKLPCTLVLRESTAPALRRDTDPAPSPA